VGVRSQRHAHLSLRSRKSEGIDDQAGWTYNAQGVAEKDGKPFKFTLLSSTGIVGVNEAIQKAMKDIGMDVDIQLMDFPTFLARFATEKKFDFITITACVQIDPDNPLVWGCGLNAYGFCSKQFDDWGTRPLSSTTCRAARRSIPRCRNSWRTRSPDPFCGAQTPLSPPTTV